MVGEILERLGESDEGRGVGLRELREGAKIEGRAVVKL